jgi:NAD(P)-dependent dehydrogenase (short-subunit alcohol dehydrogenase family)
MQKTAIITGGTAGLGYCSALRAAEEGFDVIIASRNETQGGIAKSDIQKKFPQVEIKFLALDLSDAESIESFTRRIKEPWDLLLNNAGAKIQKPFKTTKQGHEWHIGVNHLGHFALTAKLWLLAKEEATVTTVTSIVARKGQANFSNTEENFNERQAYADSKFLNLAFASELAHRLEGTSRKSTLAHPGFAKANPYGNSAVRFAENIAAQSAWRGSESIWAATSAANGKFLVPNVLELWGKPKEVQVPNLDKESLNEIWRESEKLTGVRFSPRQNFGDE